MSVPSRQADEAIDRLDDGVRTLGNNGYRATERKLTAALATVRSELGRLREELDAAHRTAAVECGRAEAAEAEVRRLREGLREIAAMGLPDQTLVVKARALLSASPTDGGGAK